MNCSPRLLPLAALLSVAALSPVVPGRAQSPAAVESPAPPDFRALLRDALFEEEANRDLDKAATGYEGILARWAEQRELAAGALFRLAEVRRKQERKDEAIALYQRFLTEFPDIDPQARLCRENLGTLGADVPGPAAAGASDSLISEEEATDLRRMKKLALDSPDLLTGTEFTTACGKGWLSVVQFLLSQNVEDEGNGLSAAAGGGHLSVVRELLSQGTPGSESYAAHWADPEHRQALDTAVDAATQSNRVEVLKFLLESGASPEGGSKEETPLTIAIFKQNKAAVDLLLEHKAKVNPDSSNTSPLYMAANSGQPVIVKRLLDLGADPDFGGRDPSTRPWVKLGPGFPVTPPGGVSFTNGFNPSSLSSGKGASPLHAAAARGNADCIELLLSAKANPNASNQGWTPLLAAVGEGNMPSVEKLLSAGADPNAGGNGEGEGKTVPKALEIAAAGGNFAITAALLKAGADPNAILAGGVTAMGYAFEPRIGETLEAWISLFLEHGADPFLSAAPAARFAPPEWRTKLLHSCKYPALATSPAVTLVYAEGLRFANLAERKAEGDSPGALPALLSTWNETGKWSDPFAVDFGKGPDWSVLHLWRKGEDGKMHETVIPVSADTAWPTLQWGDVIEVLASTAFAPDELETRRVILPGVNPGVPVPASSTIPAEILEILKSPE